MPANSTQSGRVWLAAAAAIAAAGLAGRIHNAFAYPPFHDFDGAGHALNVFELYEGRLPSPVSWSGFHPPLSYALGALLWHVLPEAVPVHSALRLLSVAAGLGALAIAWRTLRDWLEPRDAACVAALVWCAPVMAITTSMLGNEAFASLWVTWLVARAIRAPGEPGRTTRHALGSGVIASAAALSKSSALIAVAVTGLVYLLRLRSQPAQALRAAAAFGLLPALLATPFYARSALLRGDLLGVVSGGVLSDQAGTEMDTQPPGVRHVADYVRIPASTLLAPHWQAPGLSESVPGLLYASIWADGHGQFLPIVPTRVLALASVCAIAGLVPTALALRGGARMLRRRARYSRCAPAFWLAALLVAALLQYVWSFPYYSAVKASYLLGAALPAALALGVGLEAAGRARAPLRASLLAIAALATALTWWGWWEAPGRSRPAPERTREGVATAPARAVADYFASLGRDPMRTLPLTSPTFHQRHELRVVTTAEAREWLEQQRQTGPRSGAVLEQPTAAPSRADFSLDRARLGWLTIQQREQFRATAARLGVGEWEEGPADSAHGSRWVRVRVQAPGGEAFEQVFELSSDGGRWRIDAVEQTGLTEHNALAAFVAAPSEAARERLELAIRAAKPLVRQR